LVKHHIYHAPDPSLPFLLVHLTRTIDGGIIIGPNAVLGLAREGYGRFASISATPWSGWGIQASGAWLLPTPATPHMNSLLCLEARLFGGVPEILFQPATARPAAISYGHSCPGGLQQGLAIHDFLFKQTDRMLYVCNAPSPAATSALPIGSMIARQVLQAA
jgi:L-2-hydroxyglutarate oxidase